MRSTAGDFGQQTEANSNDPGGLPTSGVHKSIFGDPTEKKFAIDMLSSSRNSFGSPSTETNGPARQGVPQASASAHPHSFVAAQYVSNDSLRNVPIDKHDTGHVLKELDEVDRKAAELRSEYTNLLHQKEQLDQQIDELRKD